MKQESWNSRLAALYHSSLAIVELTETKTICEQVILALEGFMPYERCGIFIVDEKDRSIRLLAHSSKGLKEGQAKKELKRVASIIKNAPNAGVIRRVVETGKTVNIPDVSAESGYLSGDERIQSELCVPILIRNTAIGAINIESYDKNAFSSDDEELVVILTNQISLTLENSRLKGIADSEAIKKTRAVSDAKAARTMLSNAVQNMEDGFAMFDADRRLRIYNERLKDLFPGLASLINTGVSAEILNRRWMELIRGSDGGSRTASDAILFDCDAEPTVKKRTFEISRDRWVEVHENPTKPGGRMFMFMDISSEKEMERERSDFFVIMNHELRTPLTSIKGALGLIHSGAIAQVPPEIQGMVEIALRNSNRMHALINDLLDSESLSLGKMKFHMQPLDLSRLVVEQVEGDRLPARASGISCVVSGAENPTWVVGDKARLTQVMANLVSNAVKFSGERDRVEVSLTRIAGNSVRVSVRDYGVGIPPSFYDRIFERYSTLARKGALPSPGTGIGLHVAKMIVGTHKSDLRFESKEGQGTTFFFDLDLIDVH